MQTTNWIYDPNTLATGNNGTPIATGVWRALEPGDLAPTINSLNISGLVINTDQLEGMTQSGIQFLTYLSGQMTHSYSTTSLVSVSGSMNSMTTGIALPANSQRRKLYVQVVGSGGPLFLGYGTAPSTGAFNAVLAPATADFGVNGGVLSDSDFQGNVFVSGGIGVRFTIWQGTAP